MEGEQADIGLERGSGHLGHVKIKSKSVFLFLRQYIVPAFPSKNVRLRAIVWNHDHQDFIND